MEVCTAVSLVQLKIMATSICFWSLGFIRDHVWWRLFKKLNHTILDHPFYTRQIRPPIHSSHDTENVGPSCLSITEHTWKKASRFQKRKLVYSGPFLTEKRQLLRTYGHHLRSRWIEREEWKGWYFYLSGWDFRFAKATETHTCWVAIEGAEIRMYPPSRWPRME